jgi:predicted lipase
MNIKQIFIESISEPWTTIDENDIQYKIIRRDKTIYIYFQGTVSKIDWKQNFKFLAKKYKGNYIHKGFLENYTIAKDDIQNILNGFEIDKIIISGYSHGAALATLCYEDLSRKYYDVRCIVFGSPRVFLLPNKRLRNRLYRIQNYQTKGDLVTKLPFLFFGYRHVGNVIKIGKWKLLPLPKYHLNDYYEKYL